ncbi:DNA translocase FtsK [Xenorhabdus eapokensis]|uniref:Cell division protein FtsK n=1 Tax=Xenorhabdus eapokensis TaxID=1873482 RepID=A0A1Q5TFM5_9GAMM|nr:DNA translocase FtsK [Xenorhabdus eapokensis]OKO99037.1 cell division protein FtsK [Xenorhabdus eapokensis]
MNSTNEELDPLFDDVVDFVMTKEYTSTNEIKEYFSIGYNRAALLLQQMEEMEIVAWECSGETSQYKIINPLTQKITKQKKKEPNPRVFNTKQSDSGTLGEWLMAGIGFIIVIFVFIVVVFVFVSCSNRSPAPEVDYCSDDKTAYSYAKKFISSHLKAPSTAKFASYYDVKSTQPEKCKFNFIGYVDAQNSFGAMIRTPFEAIVRYDQNKDAYYLERLDM